MSSTPCHLFDGGNLYAIPDEHIALRARWPLAVKEEDRARVLQQGVRGVFFEDLRPTYCAVIVFDIGAARTAARDASLHTPVPQMHDDDASPLFVANTRRCIWCLEMHVGSVRIDGGLHKVGDSLFFPLPTRETRSLWLRVRAATFGGADTPDLVTPRLRMMASERCAPTYTLPDDLGFPALTMLPTHASPGLRLSFLALKDMDRAQNKSEFLRRAEVASSAPKSPAPPTGPAPPCPAPPFPPSPVPSSKRRVDDGPPTVKTVKRRRTAGGVEGKMPPVPLSPQRATSGDSVVASDIGACCGASASASASAARSHSVGLEDLPQDLFAVIVSQLLVHSPQTVIALRGLSRHCYDAVDTTMVDALESGSALLSRMLACQRVEQLLQLSREMEELNFDPLSLMVRKTEKQIEGDEEWHASDYACAVRRVPGQALRDVASAHPLVSRRHVRR